MNTSDESLPTPAGPSGSRSLLSRSPVLAVLAAFLLLAGLILIASTLLSQDRRPLYPNLPTFTPLSETLESEPAVLTFTELNADPDGYRDRRIQVAGNLALVAPPTCLPFAGPVIRWTLVSEELQLNAVGFENVLRLVAEGTPMTATGIWRLYRGPAGCGKEPADANVWYLAVDQILEPNPLLGEGGVALTVVPGEALPTLPPLDLEAPTAAATPTLEATLTEPTPALPGQPTIGVAATPTLPSVTVSPSPTVAGTVSATVTVNPLASPTATGTPTPTGTPGPSPTPSATTESGGGDETPGIPTATRSSDGYPGNGYP